MRDIKIQRKYSESLERADFETYQTEQKPKRRKSKLRMKKMNAVEATPESKKSPELQQVSSASVGISLHKASQIGDVKSVRSHLSLMPSLPLYPQIKIPNLVDKRDQHGWSAIHYAARHGHHAVINELIQYGADINIQTDVDLLTPLHLSTKFKHVSCMDLLLTDSARTDLLDMRGKTSLHYAARTGQQYLKTMLRYPKCIDVNQSDHDKMTPLMDAVNAGNLNSCRQLIEAGASVFSKDIGEQTTLLLTAGYDHPGVIQLLIQTAVESRPGNLINFLNSCDNEGTSPLHLACMNNQINNAKTLLEKGADVNQAKFDRSTSIHLAPILGFDKIVDLLLEYDADIKVTNSTNSTPLHNAAMFNQVACMKILIAKGADLEARDIRDMTPFHCAAWKGQLCAVEYLIQSNCDIFTVDSRQRTVLHWAVLGGHLECVKGMQEKLLKDTFDKLLNMGDDKEHTCLHLSSRNGDLELTDLLVKYGASTAVRDQDDKTPMHIAAQEGHSLCIERLFEHSKLEINDEDADGRTPMLLACHRGNYSSVKALLKCGGDFMTRGRDESNHSALTLAASEGHTEIVDLLLDNNANIEAFTKYKETALHLACQYNHNKMVTLLLSRKASLSARNIRNHTPLDVAVEKRAAESATVIMKSDRWREAMDCLDETQRTAFPALVAYMPEVAKIVLDNCVTREGGPQDEEFTITFDFKYVDICPDSDICGKRRVWYVNDMLEHECEELLTHELVTENIFTKWVSLSRYIFWLDTFYYMLLLVIVTVYVIFGDRISGSLLDSQGCPLNVTAEQLQNETIIRELQNEVFPAYSPYRTSYRDGQDEQQLTIVVYIVVAAFGLSILRAIIDITLHRLSYFTKIGSYMTWLSVISLILLINPDADPLLPCVTQWRFGWIAVLSSWMNALAYLVGVPGNGLYVIMFGRVLQSVLKVLIMICVFYIAFGSCLYITMADLKEFQSYGMAILTTFNMGFGEISFVDRVVKRESWPFYIDNIILMTIFLIVIPIALINLLVGIAVGDIEAIRSQAEIHLVKLRVMTIFGYEATMIKPIQRKIYRPIVVKQPNKPSKSAFSRCIERFRRNTKESVYYRKSGWLHLPTESSTQLDQIETILLKQTHRILELETRFSRQSELLEAIAGKLGAELDPRGKHSPERRKLTKTISTVAET